MAVIPYVKQTWTDGVSALSAARMAVIESGVNDVSYAPAVRAWAGATTSCTTGTCEHGTDPEGEHGFGGAVYPACRPRHAYQ